ncbi:MAG: MFS transporter [Elusimicrobia bacterium]|nr:MFS transporter [Elusimicrobiota bacterium]
MPQASAAPQHSWPYRTRRFINWFLLGLTYATFYMGRYNLNVIKSHVEKTFLGGSQTQFGVIAMCGFWTYALSELVNGPLADRIGGRKAILLGAFGAATFNMAMGLLFLGGFANHLIIFMSLLYSLNMFFQSFGAMSVVKVNAPWFHVDERGVFGGVFGIMISLGYVFALQTAGWIMKHPDVLPWYATFFVPTAAMAVMFGLSWLFVRDRPSEAGFQDFSTSDASDGDETPVDFKYIVQKVFTNPVLLTLMAAEFCTGFVRQSLLFFFPEWLQKVHGIAPGTHYFNYAVWSITAGGIVGGLLAGWLSDKAFQSRRPPVAFFFYLMQVVAIVGLGLVKSPLLAALGIGFACTWIFGVHGMLSGTASMDFGGKKGAASAAGMLDGIQYVASGITSVGMGMILDHFGWSAWTYSIVPFSLIGAYIMTRLWNEKPHGAKAAEALAGEGAAEPAAA